MIAIIFNWILVLLEFTPTEQMKLIAAFEILLLTKDSWDKNDFAEGFGEESVSTGSPILFRRKLFSDHEDHKDGVKDAASIGDIASDIFEPNAGSSAVRVELDGSGAVGNNASFSSILSMIMAACAINDS